MEKMQNTLSYCIRKEKESDFRKTEELVRESFWNVYRPGCQEHYVLHCFRSDPDYVPDLALVMESEGVLVGQIIFVRSKICLDKGTELSIMTFGPIAIHPKLQRQGLGLALLQYALAEAITLGVGAVAITGNPAFYGKAGFVLGKSVGVIYKDDPAADYFLVKELQPGFLQGVRGTYYDPKGYFVCSYDSEGFQQFESSFPYKEKRVLLGQLFKS